MPVICPTITTTTAEDFRTQIEQVVSFAHRIHIDLADGVFAPTVLTPLSEIWWPVGIKADLHLMYETAKPYIAEIVELKPHMVIIHAESVGNYFDIAQPFHEAGIKVGVALLQKTPVSKIIYAIDKIDHVLIFSGDLGRFGGHAKMALLPKIAALKKIKPELEIGWDGGINATNIRSLVLGGVDVLNTGGAIQKASDPHAAYATLKAQL